MLLSMSDNGPFDDLGNGHLAKARMQATFVARIQRHFTNCLRAGAEGGAHLLHGFRQAPAFTLFDAAQSLRVIELTKKR